MLSSIASTQRPPSSSEREFLAKRIAHFGVGGVALGVLALLFRVPNAIASGTIDLSYIAHVGGISATAGIWLVARYGRLSYGALGFFEALSTFLTTLMYGVMGWALVREKHDIGQVAELLLLLVLTYVVSLRAALVPSSARRTLIVTAFVGIALVPMATLSPHGFASCFLDSVKWWLLTVTLATVTSGVIYGLQREVRTAREIGQYQLIEKIGQGGMGVVYRARHRLLRRETALKILPPSRAGANAITRFEREVRLTAQLTHPNTVTVFDYGRTPEGLFYYAMELLDGATLEDVVRVTGSMPPARVAHILRQVAGALAEAHELGLVHRDVKPSNIMLCSRGGQPDVAKVLDFGLVRDKIDSPGLSVSTELLGTPLYMAPEAIVAPTRVTGASDLYSLGAVAYFLLTGHPLFDAATLVEVCSHHLHTEAPPPSKSVILPDELDELVRTCLMKDPSARPTSARDMVERLETLDDGWTDADARAWWRDNEPVLRSRVLRETTTEPRGSLTLNVDLERRGPSPRSAQAEPAGALPPPAIDVV